MKLPHDAHTVIEVAHALGGRAYVVGGAVRDHVMGNTPKDFDIEIHGVTSLKQVADALKRHGRVDEVGVAFGVLKFGQDIDVSLPRRDSKIGDGHRGFDVVMDTTMTMVEALSRRDFTINSMAYDPLDDQLIDPFGGQLDIEFKWLRYTSQAFVEDPLRVMRAVQFATRFGMRLDLDTSRMCKALIPEMKTLAKERLWGEWEKILTKGTDFVSFQTALRDTGMDQILPYRPFLGATGIEQTRVATAFYGQETKPAAVLASWAMGCSTAQAWKLFQHLDVPKDLRRMARQLRAGALAVDVVHSWTPAFARQIARTISPVTLDDATVVAHCRVRADECYKVARDEGVLFGPFPPLVTGHDLIALGLTPGPRFATILATAVAAQDDGKFFTKEEGVAWTQAYALDIVV